MPEGQGRQQTPEEAAASEAQEAVLEALRNTEFGTTNPDATPTEATHQAIRELMGEEAREAFDAATHDELRALKARMEEALNARDLDALLSNVTDDVVFTTMNGDVVRGPDEVRAYFARMMEGEDKVVESLTASFEADDLSILVRSDVAIAFGSTADQYELSDGTTMDIAARWTATLVREPGEGDEDGAWKVQAFHYSTNMFDNPVLDAQRSVLVMIMILGGLFVFGIAFWLGRKLGLRAGAKKAAAKAASAS